MCVGAASRSTAKHVETVIRLFGYCAKQKMNIQTFSTLLSTAEDL